MRRWLLGVGIGAAALALALVAAWAWRDELDRDDWMGLS
jgi:hypothetical protein